jgi:hypothetical protein
MSEKEMSGKIVYYYTSPNLETLILKEEELNQKLTSFCNEHNKDLEWTYSIGADFNILEVIVKDNER